MTVPVFIHAVLGGGGSDSGTVAFSDGTAAAKLGISRAAAVGKYLYLGALIWGSHDFTTVDGEPAGALTTWTDVLLGKTKFSSTAGSSHWRIGLWRKVVAAGSSLDMTIVKNNTTGTAYIFAFVANQQLLPGDVTSSTLDSTRTAIPFNSETTRSLFVGVKNSQTTTVALDWDLSGGATVIGSADETSGTTKLGFEFAWLDTPTLAANRTVVTTPTTASRIGAFQMQEVINVGEDIAPEVTVPAPVNIFPTQTRTQVASAVDPEGAEVTFSMTASEPWMSFTSLGQDPTTGAWQCQVVGSPPYDTPGGLSASQPVGGIAYGAGHPSTTDLTLISSIVPGGFVRADFTWAEVQPVSSTAFVWTAVEERADRIAAAGLKTLAMVGYTPAWARTGGNDKYPPNAASVDEWQEFCRQLATRLIPKGVTVYELWNEANIATFWQATPNVADYVTRVLIPGANGIRQAATAAGVPVTILTAGTAPAADGGGNIDPRTWVTGLYANGAQPYFDHIAHHPYIWPWAPTEPGDWNAFQQSADIRDIMVTNGDSAKKVWATEAGLPSRDSAPFYPTAGHDGFVSHTTKTTRIGEIFDAWTGFGSWAGPLLWYQHRNAGVEPLTDPEHGFGVVYNGGTDLPNGSRAALTAEFAARAVPGTYVATIEATDLVNTVEFNLEFDVQECFEFVKVGDVLKPIISAGGATPPPPPPPPETGEWRRWIVKTDAELAAGKYGGGGKQLMRSGMRSISDPNRAYFWVDVAHTLRSDNASAAFGSVLWHRPVDVHHGTLATTAGAVSRTSPDRAVILADDHFESANNGREGIYLTTDGGESWTLAAVVHPDLHEGPGKGSGEVGGVAGWNGLTGASENNSFPTRVFHETIVNSIHNANHWFCMVDSDGFYRSTDNGASWTRIWDVSANANVKDVYKVLESPTTQGELYLACFRNVWKLTSAHSGTLVTTNIRGSLSGSLDKRYICFEIGNDGTSPLICSVKGAGAYRSVLRDGTDWALVHADTQLEYVWVNPLNASKVLKVYIDDVGAQGRYSTSGVAGPYTPMTTVSAPGWADVGGGWGERIQGRWVGFLPHATNEQDILCHSQGVLWKTTNGGATWTSANELNCGYNSGWSWRSTYQDPENAAHYMTSVADLGPIETTNGGRSWRFSTFLTSEKNFTMSSAHGAAPMDDNPNIIIAGIGDTNHSYLMRSTTRGAQGGWTNVAPGIDRRYLGVWPYKLSPSMDAPTRLLAKRFALAGYLKTTNAGVSWVSSGVSTDAEWNGYMWNNPDVFYAIQHLGTNPRRIIHKGVVNLSTGGVAISTACSLGYSLPAKGAWAFSHTDANKLFIVGSTGDVASWNIGTSTPTNLGLMSQAALVSLNASYVWLDIQMMDVCAINDQWIVVLLNLHGESMVWRTTNGGTNWVDISKNLPRIVNGSIEWIHSTGEILFSSSAGYWIHPAPDTHIPTQPELYANCAPVDQLF